MCVTTESIMLSTADDRYVDSTTLADSFVPGPISNTALERLTVRPQQYRAIRGEHHSAIPYASSQYVKL